MIFLIVTVIKCVLQYCVNLVLHYISYFNLLICILSTTYDYLTINQINPELWYKQELTVSFPVPCGRACCISQQTSLGRSTRQGRARRNMK